VHSSPAKWYF
jgi:hypothetical protein